MRMVLCLLRASYNVTIADTDAVFLSDASSWLSGFDLVASRAAPKSTPYTARLFDGVEVPLRLTGSARRRDVAHQRMYELLRC